MIYVMSDIHGNTERFDSVMKQISLSRNDRLYILGDVVDRFPGGITLLRRIMKMPNVCMLLGNHELMMLKAAAAAIYLTQLVIFELMTDENDSMNVIPPDPRVPSRRENFLQLLRYQVLHLKE